MPEYSSTTITPADAVKVPAMNGSTSGNFQLDALRNFILASKGAANGLASLGSDGKLPLAQLPDLADDVLVYSSYATFPATGTAGKIYIAADTNIIYRWDDSLDTPAYVILTIDLSAYETKAEASELKSAISSNTARIENLEQHTGDVKTVSYPNDPVYTTSMPNLVPPSMATNGKVLTIRGKSRPWNQLFDISSQTGYNDGSLTITVGTSSMTINGTSTSVVYKSTPSTFKFISGHKYLFYMEGFSNDCYLSDQSGLDVFNDIKQTSVLTANASGGDIRITVLSGRTFSNVSLKLVVRDLTLIFPEGVPSTVAECVQKCPDILTYDSYGYSFVDTEVEGVESVGFNHINPTAIVKGKKITTTGAIQDDAFSCYVMLPVYPSTEYCLVDVNSSRQNTMIAYFDASGGYLGRDGNTSADKKVITSYAGCLYIGITCWADKDYLDTNICFNLSQTSTSVNPHNGDYVPYFKNTLSLPTSVIPRSAGSVSDIFELNEEVKVGDELVNKSKLTENVGSYTFDGTETWYPYEHFKQTDVMSQIKPSSSSSVVSDVLAPNLVACKPVDLYTGTVASGIAITDGGRVRIGLNDSLDGKTIYFEKATPEVTLGTPVINNIIATEAGGTINTIQTQTPVIDNCLDVAYLAL